MFDFVLGLNIFICGDGQQLENDIRIEQTVWMFHVNTFMINSYFNDLHMIYIMIYIPVKSYFLPVFSTAELQNDEFT